MEIKESQQCCQFPDNFHSIVYVQAEKAKCDIDMLIISL